MFRRCTIKEIVGNNKEINRKRSLIWGEEMQREQEKKQQRNKMKSLKFRMTRPKLIKEKMQAMQSKKGNIKKILN